VGLFLVRVFDHYDFAGREIANRQLGARILRREKPSRVDCDLLIDTIAARRAIDGNLVVGADVLFHRRLPQSSSASRLNRRGFRVHILRP